MRVSLSTTNCIVTGKPARIWTGHVLVRTSGKMRRGYANSRTVIVSVTAGFISEATARTIKCDDVGCFGDWKPEYGLRVDKD